MERKVIQLDAKSLDEGAPEGFAGGLEGYGNNTGNVDLGYDETQRGAYKHLDELVSHGAFLLGHEWAGLEIGVIADAYEDDKGLRFKAWYHDTPRGQEARKVAKNRLSLGKFVGLSIGYQTIEAEYIERDGKEVRLLKAIKVHEVSQVITPMNPLSGATGIKSLNSFEDRTEGALAALKSVSEELERIRALRLEDGRKWPSEFNRTRIEAFAADTEGLLSQFTALLKIDAPVDASVLADLERAYQAVLA